MKLRLIHKLLIAMFASTALVLVLIVLLMRANLGRDFENFLQRQERAGMPEVAAQLADWYASEGSWDSIVEDPRRFYAAVFGTMRRAGAFSEPPPEGRQRPGRRPPPGQHGEMRNRAARFVHDRLVLLDADQQTVVGQAPPQINIDSLFPIQVDGATVGWVGMAAKRGLRAPEELDYLKRQRRLLLAGLGMGLAVAALLAWLLARHLGRPVSAAAAGIRSMASGNYESRVETRGDDEIARLGKDVNQLASSLADHRDARQRWMADIAHELRTPLAIISGELEAMADGVRPLDEGNLASVREEVSQLTALVNDIHDLALSDSGSLAYQMERLDLTALLAGAVDSIRVRLDQKGLDIELELPATEFRIEGDPRRIRQLLGNLLENALRYTDAPGRIQVQLSQQGATAVLTVSDTAPGVESGDHERLFERFYRVEASRNRHTGGSGLGLAICRNIAEAHGGEIEAGPAAQGGLAIRVSLPLKI